jgi:hypothetical protein
MTKQKWLLLGGALAASGSMVVLAESGCSSSSGGGGTAAQKDTGKEAGAAGFSLKWNIYYTSPGAGNGRSDAAPDAGPVPVPGVKVCVYQQPSIPCVMSDADGVYTLEGLPPLQDIAITYEKDGFRPTLKAIETASTDTDATGNPTYFEPATDADPPIGSAVDWTDKGWVSFFALGPGALNGDAGSTVKIVGDPGATVTISPQSGVGPLFVTDDNQFDTSATKLIDLSGYVFNVDPGTYTMTFTDPNNDCEPISFPFGGWGYPGDSHNLSFPVVKGFGTELVGVICTPNSVIAGGDGGTSAPDASGSTGSDDGGSLDASPSADAAGDGGAPGTGDGAAAPADAAGE